MRERFSSGTQTNKYTHFIKEVRVHCCYPCLSVRSSVSPSKQVCVTWTLSIFQKVDKSYSKIWLGMSCRCALKFSIAPWVQTKIGNLRFCDSLIAWTLLSFQEMGKWNSMIWFSMFFRPNLKVKKYSINILRNGQNDWSSMMWLCL